MKFQHFTNEQKAQMGLLLGLAMMGPLSVMAGAGGGEFTEVYDQLTAWSNGILGKVLGIAALLVGLGVGVIKQSVIAAVVGIAMALTAAFGPGVIDGIITAGVHITTPLDAMTSTMTSSPIQ